MGSDSERAGGQPPRDRSADAEAFARLLVVVDQLREHCLWTAAQTHETLAPYAAEEAEELAEAVADLRSGRGSGVDLASELGDLLLQVVLQARVGEDAEDPAQRVSIDMVVEALTSKLIRRSPHVFSPDGELSLTPMSLEEIDAQWDAVKAQESHGQN